MYVLTQRDAKIISDWLNENNISASPYFSDVTNDKFETRDAYREFLEEQLKSFSCYIGAWNGF